MIRRTGRYDEVFESSDRKLGAGGWMRNLRALVLIAMEPRWASSRSRA